MKKENIIFVLNQHIGYLESFKSEWKEGKEYLYYITKELIKKITDS